MCRMFAVLLLLLAIPAHAEDRPCSMVAATYQNPYYRVQIPHEEIARSLTYTAEPPVELITQHYVTATLVLTIPDTIPPITYTVRTFAYSETVSTLGYTPLTPTAYAYLMRSPAPFRVWGCVDGAAHPHIFLPLVNRPTIDAITARRPVERRRNAPTIAEEANPVRAGHEAKRGDVRAAQDFAEDIPLER